MADLAEDVDGLPNICGSEECIRQAMQASRTTPVFLPQGASGFGEINSAFAIALHMHQPLIPAGGPELPTAQLISNLQWMLDNPDSGDNHNARVFLWCYQRMGEFVPHLLDEGFQPRVMLEYSGTPPWATSGACACGKGERCSKRSNWIAAASPVCSAELRGRRSTSSPPSGKGPGRWPKGHAPARSSRFRRRHRTLAGRSCDFIHFSAQPL
jgi:hypothetical protein